MELRAAGALRISTLLSLLQNSLITGNFRRLR